MTFQSFSDTRSLTRATIVVDSQAQFSQPQAFKLSFKEAKGASFERFNDLTDQVESKKSLKVSDLLTSLVVNPDFPDRFTTGSVVSFFPKLGSSLIITGRLHGSQRVEEVARISLSAVCCADRTSFLITTSRYGFPTVISVNPRSSREDWFTL